MKKYIYIMAALLSVILFTGCNHRAKGDKIIEQLARQMNDSTGRELANGLVFISCDYHAGDSLFTYQIKVNDARMDSVQEDTLAYSLRRDLLTPTSEKISKLVKVLAHNNVGLRYIYHLPDNQMRVVVIPADDLKKVVRK